MAPKYLVLTGVFLVLHASSTSVQGSAQDVDNHLQTQVKRSVDSQPIMDEAALQEAEIKEATRATDDTSHSKSHPAYLERSAKPSKVRGSKQAVAKARVVGQHAVAKAHDDDETEVPVRQNLRASSKANVTRKKQSVPQAGPVNVLDPAAWTVINASSGQSSMEQQLTDLLKSGGGLAATPFGKSVKQIEHLIENDMMVKVKQAHENNQAQLNKEAESIVECGKTKTVQVAGANKKKVVYLKTSPLHKTCRAAEAGSFTSKTESYNEMKDKERIKKLKCKEFAMVSKQVGDQQANGEIVKRSGSERTESYVRRLTSTICGKYPPGGKGGGGKGGFLDVFIIAKEGCEKATKEYNAHVKKYTTLVKEYNDKKSECDSLQDQMDGASCKRAVEMKDACETYAECYYDRKNTHLSTVKMVKTEEKDRMAEWRGLKRMQCLMTAFKDNKVSDSEISECRKQSHDTSHLKVKYPKIVDLVTCTVPNLYPSTPEYKLAEFAPLPALAKGKEEANECTGVIEINTKPAKGSPASCKCRRVTLNGPYSAGPLVECSNCLQARRSQDKISCPEGTKLFSPRSESDWTTVLSSAGELRAPNFIVDVTIPQKGCGYCKKKAMNSGTPQGKQWHTSDGSPWWLRSTTYKEPDANGQPNCYLGVHPAKTAGAVLDVNNIEFGYDGCKYHSKSYYCQLKDQTLEPKKGSPASCKCNQVVLAGSYSAGSLLKCTNCLDVSRSMQKNSCPLGTKIFSPASSEDWKTFLASAKPLRSPHWIIDVTRPQGGCGGCKHAAMNSKSPSQRTWRTSDGSPWWLRSSLYNQPSGDYNANCYMDLWKTPVSETSIMFNDWKCNYHANSYYCQPVKPKK